MMTVMERRTWEHRGRRDLPGDQKDSFGTPAEEQFQLFSPIINSTNTSGAKCLFQVLCLITSVKKK